MTIIKSYHAGGVVHRSITAIFYGELVHVF